jgi:hypothetical protein
MAQEDSVALEMAQEDSKALGMAQVKSDINLGLGLRPISGDLASESPPLTLAYNPSPISTAAAAVSGSPLIFGFASQRLPPRLPPW